MEIMNMFSQYFHSQALSWTLGVIALMSVLKEIEVIYTFSKRHSGW
jgi:hypothetical protein